jgi:ubiquinone/menaquinone biosynthesis C-methylase UbiE
MEVKKRIKINYWDTVAIEAEREELATRRAKWQRAATNWLAHYVENKSRDFIIQTIERYVRLSDDAQILDVGCGPGKWVNFFAKRGFSVTGIDSSPWMIRLAKKMVKHELKSHVKFYVMNAAKLNLPSNSYDLVNCVTVLQHILNEEDWRKAVYEMVRVTKPLGYTLLFEAAPSFPFKKNTARLLFKTMREYVSEFEKVGARLVYWRGTDISFPITFLGLKKYAASFGKRRYYYTDSEIAFLPPKFLSLLSRIVATFAKQIDYELAETPLGFLSVGKILLFRKVRR